MIKQIPEPVDYDLLKKQLDAFKSFYGNNDRCTQNANNLFYRVAKGNAEAASDQANELIKKHKLLLVAKPTTMRTNDSFIVEANRAELTAGAVDAIYQPPTNDEILAGAFEDIKDYVHTKAAEVCDRITELTNSSAGRVAYNKINSLLKTEA